MVELCCAAEARAEVVVLLYKESESDLNPGPCGVSQLQPALANNNTLTFHNGTLDPSGGVHMKVPLQHGRANLFVDGTSRFSEVQYTKSRTAPHQLRAATLDMKI